MATSSSPSPTQTGATLQTEIFEAFAACLAVLLLVSALACYRNRFRRALRGQLADEEEKLPQLWEPILGVSRGEKWDDLMVHFPTSFLAFID